MSGEGEVFDAKRAVKAERDAPGIWWITIYGERVGSPWRTRKWAFDGNSCSRGVRAWRSLLGGLRSRSGGEKAPGG